MKYAGAPVRKRRVLPLQELRPEYLPRMVNHWGRFSVDGVAPYTLRCRAVCWGVLPQGGTGQCSVRCAHIADMLRQPPISWLYVRDAACWGGDGLGNRDRRQKFVELAESRVRRTLKDIQLIGNLSNTSAYCYTEADVKKIFAALQRDLDAARARFSQTGGRAGPNFRL